MAATIARQRERQVVIRPEPFSQGFDVSIEPPLEGAGNFDAERRCILAARAYAATIGERLGYPVRDLTGEAAG